MKLKVFPLELRNYWYIVYFILQLLSKLNSFAYNLLDVISSVYLEISYFSTIRWNLIPILTCIYSLFVSFATNAFTYIGLMTKIYSTNFQSNGQSLLLITITGVNCIQCFLQCKLRQSKVTNKTITGTKQYKINKKQRKMNLTHMIRYT